jgi:hypothetical protein
MSRLPHTLEECPLHQSSFGELERIVRMFPVKIPQEYWNKYNKSAIVRILHDYIEENQPLRRMACENRAHG